MRPIAPRIDGADEITIAEEQPEYAPLTAAIVRYSDRVERVCRWTFTADERVRIAAGEDIYFGTPAAIQLIPHWLSVGFSPPRHAHACADPQGCEPPCRCACGATLVKGATFHEDGRWVWRDLNGSDSPFPGSA